MKNFNQNSNSLEEQLVQATYQNAILQMKIEEMLMQRLSREKLDFLLKKNLDAFSIDNQLNLFKVIQLISASCAFFMPTYTYNNFINLIEPIIKKQNFDLFRKTFTEQIIKLTPKDKKPYLLLIMSAIVNDTPISLIKEPILYISRIDENSLFAPN